MIEPVDGKGYHGKSMDSDLFSNPGFTFYWVVWLWVSFLMSLNLCLLIYTLEVAISALPCAYWWRAWHWWRGPPFPTFVGPLPTLPWPYVAAPDKGTDIWFRFSFFPSCLYYQLTWTNCIYRFCRGRSGAKKNKADGEGTHFIHDLKGHKSVY